MNIEQNSDNLLVAFCFTLVSGFCAFLNWLGITFGVFWNYAGVVVGVLSGIAGGVYYVFAAMEKIQSWRLKRQEGKINKLKIKELKNT